MARTKTNEEFVAEVYDLVGDEYTPLTPYIHSKEKVWMRHNICGHEYPVRPSAFTSDGNRCPKCADTTKTHEEFVREVYDLVGSNYTVLGVYKNGYTPILMRHNICGHEYPVRPATFTSVMARRCPLCAENNKVKRFTEMNKTKKRK